WTPPRLARAGAPSSAATRLAGLAGSSRSPRTDGGAAVIGAGASLRAGPRRLAISVERNTSIARIANRAVPFSSSGSGTMCVTSERRGSCSNTQTSTAGTTSSTTSMIPSTCHSDAICSIATGDFFPYAGVSAERSAIFTSSPTDSSSPWRRVTVSVRSRGEAPGRTMSTVSAAARADQRNGLAASRILVTPANRARDLRLTHQRPRRGRVASLREPAEILDSDRSRRRGAIGLVGKDQLSSQRFRGVGPLRGADQILVVQTDRLDSPVGAQLLDPTEQEDRAERKSPPAAREPLAHN